MLDQSKNIDSSLEPLDEYVVIQPVSDETETRAGLILPASALATVAVHTGIVTAVGSEPNGIERGDKVLYPHEAGYDVRLGGIEVKVLKRSELIGRTRPRLEHRAVASTNRRGYAEPSLRRGGASPSSTPSSSASFLPRHIQSVRYPLPTHREKWPSG